MLMSELTRMGSGARDLQRDTNRTQAGAPAPVQEESASLIALAGTRPFPYFGRRGRCLMAARRALRTDARLDPHDIVPLELHRAHSAVQYRNRIARASTASVGVDAWPLALTRAHNDRRYPAARAMGSRARRLCV